MARFSGYVALLLLTIVLVVSTMTKASAVNCSYAACLTQCQKGATPNGCSKWCTDQIQDRKNAGQCKK
jgi:hypothetical protein